MHKIQADVAITTIDRQAIVFIPDTDLIEADTAYGIDFIRDLLATTGNFPRLLDLSELLRMVQAAEIIAERGTHITPMMAFDHYLTERAE